MKLYQKVYKSEDKHKTSTQLNYAPPKNSSTTRCGSGEAERFLSNILKAINKPNI